MSLESALAFAEGSNQAIIYSPFEAICALRVLSGELRRLQCGATVPAPAVPLCKDCRWFREMSAMDSYPARRVCMRPIPVEPPDYVMGDTTRSLGIGCLSERVDAPTSCGPSGRYWAAKETR